jgi:hypothetical protein
VKPAETHYRIEDTQVIVPRSAKERGGIQPVVDLEVDGDERADVAAGKLVTFTATIEVPSGAGKVVKAEWDFEGAGDYPVSAKLDAPAEVVRLTATHTYSKSGTYFPVLRATLHRAGDATTLYARVQNIGRARVVVG